MNPWEVCALQYPSGYEAQGKTQLLEARTRVHSSTFDSLIYPGLYSASGFDILSILLQVISRPAPQIDLGTIDISCPLVMCDLKSPDTPIVYASDSFAHMTGYSPAEVVGKNCRFLQAPGGNVRVRSARKFIDKDVIRRMRKAVDGNAEVQLEVANYKKGGQPFTNMLAIVPIRWKAADFNYSIGFMCEKED